ncbi:MAG: gamma-glutamyl-gamma-aminobutyrate hydrolase family protein [Actinomycetota bacterium]|nr:gamma-glutamyl-gamma-aminobutyrate hydrolase family protein [Actinomycetota bacterium]
MARAVVDFVITEHPPALTIALERHYEVIRRRIERLAGVPVRAQRYVDAEGFDGAAVVLSGSFAPWAVHDPDALARLGESVGRFEGAVLGICAGMQLQTIFAGGAIGPRERPELGYGPFEVLHDDGLLDGLGPLAIAYQHHSFDVTSVPQEFVVLARSAGCAVEAIAAPDRRWWGTQFHPERFTVRHPDGARVLRNFFALAGLEIA